MRECGHNKPEPRHSHYRAQIRTQQTRAQAQRYCQDRNQVQRHGPETKTTDLAKETFSRKWITINRIINQTISKIKLMETHLQNI